MDQKKTILHYIYKNVAKLNIIENRVFGIRVFYFYLVYAGALVKPSTYAKTFQDPSRPQNLTSFPMFVIYITTSDYISTFLLQMRFRKLMIVWDVGFKKLFPGDEI